MKISIDADSCTGHGRCWENAPDLVDCDDVGRGVVRDPGAEIPAQLVAQAQLAVSACPERAVVLSD